MQVAKATASWLTGMHDPFEDINIVSASAAEHKSLRPSNGSPHVTAGTWGVRPLRVSALSDDPACPFYAADLLAYFDFIFVLLRLDPVSVSVSLMVSCCRQNPLHVKEAVNRRVSANI